MLVRSNADTEIKDCPSDKAQPLVDELLHEVASNFAARLASSA